MGQRDLIWSHLISFSTIFHHHFHPPWNLMNFMWFCLVSPNLARAWPVFDAQGEKEEIDIFKGIDEMREVMTKTQAQHGDVAMAFLKISVAPYPDISGVSVTTCHNPEPTYPTQAFSSYFQEWWNHLLNIKHGEPCELPEDVDVQAMQVGNYGKLWETWDIVGLCSQRLQVMLKNWMQVESSAKPTSPDVGLPDLVQIWSGSRVNCFEVLCWTCWTAQGLGSEPCVFGKVWEIRIILFLHLLYPNCCWGIENKMYINIYINMYITYGISKHLPIWTPLTARWR